MERVLREGHVVGLANHSCYPDKERRGGKRSPSKTAQRPSATPAAITIGVVIVFHDVTEKHRAEAERKRAEEAVRASEEHYRSLFENMLDGFAYCRMLYDEQAVRKISSISTSIAHSEN